jgi:hypothetical protein
MSVPLSLGQENYRQRFEFQAPCEDTADLVRSLSAPPTILRVQGRGALIVQARWFDSQVRYAGGERGGEGL